MAFSATFEINGPQYQSVATPERTTRNAFSPGAREPYRALRPFAIVRDIAADNNMRRVRLPSFGGLFTERESESEDEASEATPEPTTSPTAPAPTVSESTTAGATAPAPTVPQSTTAGATAPPSRSQSPTGVNKRALTADCVQNQCVPIWTARRPITIFNSMLPLPIITAPTTSPPMSVIQLSPIPIFPVQIIPFDGRIPTPMRMSSLSPVELTLCNGYPSYPRRLSVGVALSVSAPSLKGLVFGVNKDEECLDNESYLNDDNGGNREIGKYYEGEYNLNCVEEENGLSDIVLSSSTRHNVAAIENDRGLYVC